MSQTQKMESVFFSLSLFFIRLARKKGKNLLNFVYIKPGSIHYTHVFEMFEV